MTNKNVEAEINQNFKNGLGTFLGLRELIENVFILLICILNDKH